MKNTTINLKNKIYNNYLEYAKRYCSDIKKDIDFSGIIINKIEFSKNLDVILKLSSNTDLVIPKKWFERSF